MKKIETNERERSFFNFSRMIFDNRILKRRALPPISNLSGALRPVGLELVKAIGGNVEAVERIQRESAERSKSWFASVKQLRSEGRLPSSRQARRTQLHPPSPAWSAVLPGLSSGFWTQRVLPTGDTSSPEPADQKAEAFDTTLSANVMANGTGSSGIEDVFTTAYFGFSFTPPESIEYECVAFINIDGDYALYSDDGWPDSKSASVGITCGIAAQDFQGESLIGTFPTSTATTLVFDNVANQPVLYRGGDNIADAAMIHEYPDPIVDGPLTAGIQYAIVAVVFLNAYAQGEGSFAQIHLSSISCPLLFIRPQT
jgi:hypothetical protein